MKRDVFRILGVCAGLCALEALWAPAAPALAEANTGAAAFADGVKGLLSLTYDGMSRDGLTKATSWPLAKTYQTWFYGGRRNSGDVYLYPGSDAGGKFSLTYDDIEVASQHHFVVRALTTQDPLSEGNGCLPIRDLRKYAAGAGWTNIETYAAMLTHGFTAQKGKLSLDVRVDVGMGQTTVAPPDLDDKGCVGAVTIRDVTAGG